MRALVWLRRDLRVSDNRALVEACAASSEVIALATITPGQWEKHNDSPQKIAFHLACLEKMAAKLDQLNIPLKIVNAHNFAQLPEMIVTLAHELKCSAIYYNHEYEVNEQSRDKAVSALLKAHAVKTYSFHDRIMIQPGKILTGSGGYYTIFTPFKRSWLNLAKTLDLEPKHIPHKQKPIKGITADKLKPETKKWKNSLWQPGEDAAMKRLKCFLAHEVDNYDPERDFPDKESTSMLSPWLANGSISPRQCLKELMSMLNGHYPENESSAGLWLSELIWREFYYHILAGYPRISKSKAFKASTEKICWRYDQNELECWKQGMTGYPIVDAAMRQMNQTGWMHNRLRMVSAMFLSKHLLIDWREGEKYFMQNLIDGDLAANNGGWQWSASTGTDAVPYFRIFNPFSQSKRFDSAGAFIKKFCPELAEVPSSTLHDARKLSAYLKQHKINYPQMIVDHSFARERALAAFKALK